MYCSGCGYGNDEGAAACRECGQLLPAEAPGYAGPTGRRQLTAIEERTWGMYCHLSAFAGFLVPFGGLVAPIVIWQIKKAESAFVDDQGKEAVNFQISMLIYTVVSAILCLLLIGFVLLVALLIFEVVMLIKAALAANNGQYFRYPLNMRFIR